MRQTKTVLALLVLFSGLQLGVKAPVTEAQQFEMDTGASAQAIAEAIAADPSTVTGAAWVARPPAGTPTALATGFLAGFPRDAATFGILTTGNAELAPQPNTSPSSGANNGGTPVRGDTDFDVVVLRIDVDVPAGANCLVGIEFRFFSEEYPEYVGSPYNDAFVLELDTSTWTTNGSAISAPDNFAFDPAGNVISINAAGVTSMTAADAAGTTYDGATPVLTAATPITPGAHSIYLSIFDQGDQIYDSAVFVDNLRFGTVADVPRDCRPGAQVVDRQRPLPLLGAHGITGVAEDMQPNLDFAASVVDGLPGTLSTDTAPIDSVWDNAVTLAVDAFTLQDQHRSGAVNIIAHSKGGLDSRVAMWAIPDWFEDLAMLATPNGGAGLADTLCRGRRIGINVFSDMGPCNDDSNGLYNLQTRYIRDVYNAVVRDSPQHDFWIAAGDCMGPVWTEEGRASCNATLIIGNNCTDIDGWLGLGDADGENAVCVWSAFAQVNGFDPGGRHFAIDPIFEGLDHTDMRQDACPNTAVLAWMYGPFYPDNPWITGDGSACRDMPRLDGGFGGFQSDGLDGAGAPLVPVPAAALQEPPEVRVGPLQLQRMDELTLGADGRGSLTVGDEGAGFGVLLLAEEGVIAGVELRNAAGQVVEPLVTGDVDVFETEGSLGAVYPSVGTGTLTVEGTPGASVGVGVSVVSDVVAATEAEVLADGRVEITATLSGASPSVANAQTVTARIGDPGEIVTVALPRRQISGQRITYGAVIDPVRGRYQPVDVTFAGPHNRLATTGFVLPDGSGSIDALAADRLVDTDGDGAADTIELDIAVTTDVAGSHEVSLELAAADGTVVGTGPGHADLDAGPGVVTVTIGLAEMASVGVAGPYEVRDVLLTRGPERHWVARVATLGLTSAVPLAVLGSGRLALSRPGGSGHDTDGDGVLDTLTWTWVTWAPEAGTYRFDGSLLGPNGRLLETFGLEVELEEGPNVVTQDFDGSVVGEHLAGRYTLVDLTGTLDRDPDVFARAPAGFTDVLDPALWTGGDPTIWTLIERWKAAYLQGAITSHGFYQSELNRLERVVAVDVRHGNRTRAVKELEGFLDHVESRSGKEIDATTAASIAAYTRALIGVLRE